MQMVLFLGMVAALDISTPAYPDEPKDLPEVVTKKWKDRNLAPGWFARIRQTGSLGFEQRKELIFGEFMPAFERYGQWEAGKLADLPEPEFGFGLQVRDPRITIDHIREFSRFKNLKGLIFMACEFTPGALAELTKLEQLEFLILYPGRGDKLGNAGLKQVVRLKNLRTLGLRMNDVTDAGLVELLKCEKLVHLEIGMNLDVTDAGMKTIAKMTNLRSLDIYYTRVSDAGLREIGTMTKLQMLDLTSLSITDTGVSHLAGLTELRQLQLYDEKITDASAKVLCGMKKLEYLGLPKVKLTDVGLKELGGLEHLWHLDLSGTAVTDASVGVLTGFRKLTQLNIRSAKVTSGGANVVTTTLPKVKLSQ
jgi:hypothetical protein